MKNTTESSDNAIAARSISSRGIVIIIITGGWMKILAMFLQRTRKRER